MSEKNASKAAHLDLQYISDVEHVNRVVERIRDAEILYNAGRTEGSLLSLLVAIAGTSRRRFPHGTKRSQDSGLMSDKDCFVQFLSDEMPALTANPMFTTKRFELHVAGREDNFQNILYDYLRNPHVHEGGPDKRIRFVHGSQCYLNFENRLQLTTSHWIHRGLYRVLMLVPENDGIRKLIDFTELLLIPLDGWEYLAFESWSDCTLSSFVGLPARREKPIGPTLDELARKRNLELYANERNAATKPEGVQ